MTERFIQIHTLTSYSSALLNRDDAGFAKRIPFGGTTRTRVSSQCLKRHWRTFDGEHGFHELGTPASIRSRVTFEHLILKPLLEQDNVPEPLALAVTQALMGRVLGKSEKAQKEMGEKDEDASDAKKGRTKKAAVKRTQIPSARTKQVTVLGRPEIDYLLLEARAVCAEVTDPAKAAAAVDARLGKDGKKNIEAMKLASGFDAALFGRMVTSDILARGDAAIHVAHAFTVHEEASETDYFSAVDELLRESEDELGSGHINSSELTGGLFYGYVVVDVPLLLSNLEGVEEKDWESADRTLGAEVVQRLVHLVATVSPGAKRGSTAPYAYAHFVLAEVGKAQPRTLANAFLKPVRPSAKSPDLVASTLHSLQDHVVDLDEMYGVRTERRAAAFRSAETVCQAMSAERSSIDILARWCGERVRG